MPSLYCNNTNYRNCTICRKSASVQIIAHEPSRCEGCFDGRLPLLLIVVFIALVLFLLCVGVILDAEGGFMFFSMPWPLTGSAPNATTYNRAIFLPKNRKMCQNNAFNGRWKYFFVTFYVCLFSTKDFSIVEVFPSHQGLMTDVKV